jgi:hypothetical protein
MVKNYSENFVQFKAKRFAKLVRLLTIAEGYIFGRDPRAIGADYWGVCEGSVEENTIVRLSDGLEGLRLRTTWEDVAATFPELVALMDEFGLHYYIGKNYIGNWGMHRHIYDETSTMNLCILVKGNDKGTVNFHDINELETDFLGMQDDNILEILENPGEDFIRNTMTESVDIRDGDIYSFNTGVWHSHLVKGSRAELFLLHFKNATSVDDILRKFEWQ